MSRATRPPARLAAGVEELGVALVAMLAGWVALWSWAPLDEQPHRFLVPALLAGLVIVGVGTVARLLRLPAALVLVLQVLACVVFVVDRFASGGGPAGWLPTPTRLSAVADLVREGSATINHYASPVPAQFAEVVVFLTVGGTLMLLAVDLFACGLRRVPLAGLPLLLTLTIPISVLVERLSLWVFVVTAVLFLVLLLWQQRGRVHSWGRDVGPVGVSTHAGSLVTAAATVALAALAGSLLLPGLVPVSQGLPLHGRGGSGNGDASTTVTVVNPLIDLRRDLVRKTHTPMITARTNAPDPSYLRLTVLDEFTGDQWRPSTRRLPDTNDLSGPLPGAPGLTAAVPGVQTQWQLRLARHFVTGWLPTPYPTSQVDVRGDWRYDARTLDIANVGATRQSEGLSYGLDAFAPDFPASLLRVAPPTAPPEIQQRMTALPADLPPIIRAVAGRVARGAKTNYARAVALQDWFRRSGGFTYSTAAGPGSGMQLIADFITRGKVGYCEQFAAAMAIMGRSLGIPARVVVGFVNPTQTGPHTWRYTSDDLHAWPEFYFDGAGWVRFEPTPAVRTGAAPPYTRPHQSTAPPVQPSQLPMPSSSAAPIVPPLPGGHGGHGGGPGGVSAWVVAAPLLVLALVLALLPRWVRDRRRRRWLAPGQPAAGFARGAWLELRSTALDHGYDWVEQRSPRETMRRLQGRVTSDLELGRALAGFVEFQERARYAPGFAPAVADEQRIRDTVRDWSEAIRENARPRARRWAPWLPRTVFSREVPSAR